MDIVDRRRLSDNPVMAGRLGTAFVAVLGPCALAVSSEPGLAAGRCIVPGPWQGSVDDAERLYVNASGGRTLLEFQAPGDENERGPVAAEATSFAAVFKGLIPGRRYMLSTTLANERSDGPYVLGFTGLRAATPRYSRAVASGKTATVRVAVTATDATARLFWRVEGHNKMWAFVSATSLCAL